MVARAEEGRHPDIDFTAPREWNPNGIYVGIAGMGLVTPLGLDVESTWNGFVNGANGMKPLRETLPIFNNYLQIGMHIAGIITDFNPRQHLKGIVPSTEVRYLSRAVQLALKASFEALSSVKLSTGEPANFIVPYDVEVGDGKTITLWRINEQIINPSDIAVIAGTGIAGAPEAIVDAQRNLDNGDSADAKHVFQALFGGMGTRPSMAFDMRNEAMTLSEECATGNAIQGRAMDLIRLGRAKAVLVVASESAMLPVGADLFATLPATTPEKDPKKGPVSLNKKNNGFGYSEGAAAMLLINEEFGRKRGIAMPVELAGYGAAADAHHKSFPHPEGRGAKAAMIEALRDAGGFSQDGKLYANLHATGTPGYPTPNDSADAIEARAIRDVVRGNKDRLAGSSGTKTMSGHLLGAATLAEGVICIKAVEEGVMPPTTKYESQEDVIDDAREINIIVNEAQRDPDVAMALNNGFGFGGTAAVTVYKKR